MELEQAATAPEELTPQADKSFLTYIIADGLPRYAQVVRDLANRWHLGPVRALMLPIRNRRVQFMILEQ
jgi:hypothetical protein